MTAAAVVAALGGTGLLTSANIISLVAVIGLMITAAAVVGGSFRVSRNTATVTRYKEAADSWQAKAIAQEQHIAELRTEVTSLQADNGAKDAKISELQGRINVLQEVVTGKGALEELAREHNEFISQWQRRTDEVTKEIGDIRGEARAIHERLDAISAQLERRER
jgi:chromosome segregation ATPase